MSDAASDSAANLPREKSPTSLGPKAYTSALAWILFLIPAILGIAGDQWLKLYSFPNGFPQNQELWQAYAGRHPAIDPDTNLAQAPWPVIPKVLGFTTTINQGAVFGIGQGKVSIFLAFSLVALAIILWVFITSSAKHRVVHFALGLITAGAIGNLYDRAFLHGVRDMLKFEVNWYPYIFNIADVLLCIGVPLLILRWTFIKDDKPAKTPA
jgi:lipoprotein signal peptidase